jgi:ATP-binding cassette subfamily B protein
VTAFALTRAAGAALDGNISLGELTVLVGAIMNVGNVGTVTTDDYILEHGLGGFPSLGDLEHEVELLDRAADGMVSPVDKPQHEIRFQGVTFTYPRQAAPVLHEVNLAIPAGKSLAIVGENGAGKSTLLKLLAGFHRPTSGRVTVDGTDLADLQGASWQRRLAPVFQEFVRYPLPARENVGFGAVSRLDEERLLQQAADRARASGLISKLPAGWDTVLARQYTGGVELSGGEWQRIALARAFVAVENGAGVVILDEPTANLDPLTEVELYEELLEATRGLTTILVSHRFPSVRKADHIVVLHKGRVVEEGTHDDLVALRGRYARMFATQAAPFLATGEREQAATS